VGATRVRFAILHSRRAGRACGRPLNLIVMPKWAPPLSFPSNSHEDLAVIENRTLTIRRFRTGSVFRIVAAGAFLSLVPFACLMGVFALFGFHTVTWNHQPLTGIVGLIASPFIGLFLAALFTAFFGVCLAFGLWLYSKIRPLTLHILEETDGGA